MKNLSLHSKLLATAIIASISTANALDYRTSEVTENSAGSSQFTIAVGVESTPFTLVFPSLGLDGASPGQLYNGYEADGTTAAPNRQAVSLTTINADFTDVNAATDIFDITFSGYEAGQATLSNNTKVDGIAMIASDGHFGGVVQSLRLGDGTTNPTTIPTSSNIHSIQGCGVTITDTATTATITFGLNTSCTVQATGEFLDGLNNVPTTAAVATDRAAANTNYQATINAYVAQI